MKPTIDLDKAAEAESFGALAVHSGVPRRTVPSPDGHHGLTAAQREAASEIAHSLMKIARDAGAEKSPVIVGDVSLELRGLGADEALLIKTAAHL